MLDDKTFLDEALKIVCEADRNDATLRIVGALAVRLHCQDHEALHIGLKRLEDERSFTDIDLAGYSKQKHTIRQVMEDRLGFKTSAQALLMRGRERLIYNHPQGLYQVDVFLDCLRFSHDVCFGSDPRKGRLGLDFPTITPTDILLCKIQIHDIAEKDVKDLLTILRAHDLSLEEAKDMINTSYIASLLAEDWGFWYDSKANLRKAASFAKDYHLKGMLTQEDLADISIKINRLISHIESQPKTREWINQERKGPGKKWWRDVEEVVR